MPRAPPQWLIASQPQPAALFAGNQVRRLSAEQLLDAIGAVTGAPTGLYIHVPFCDGKCPYCAFYSVEVDPARARRWLAAVQREYARFAEAHGAPVFDTVYIGGGTPSRLEPDLVEALIQWVARLLPPGGAAEWSLEVNPG